jgi:hypothetical protein
LVVLLIVVTTAVFIVTGYLFSLILPLTLFQPSILSIGATLVLMYITHSINANKKSDEDDYEDKKEYNNFTNRQFIVVDTKKLAGMNLALVEVEKSISIVVESKGRK